MKNIKVNYTEDIALKLSKKHGISKTMAVRNINYIHKRINSIMKDKETVQFSFGDLGYAIVSFQMLRNYDRGGVNIRNRDLRRYKLKKIERLREEGVIGKRLYRRMRKRSRINMEFYNLGMSLKELEDYQNDYCERRK